MKCPNCQGKPKRTITRLGYNSQTAQAGICRQRVCGNCGTQYLSVEIIASPDEWQAPKKQRRILGGQATLDELAEMYPRMRIQKIAEKFNVNTETIRHHLRKKLGDLKEYKRQFKASEESREAEHGEAANPESKGVPWRDVMQARNIQKQEEVELIKQLRGQGLTWKEVGAELGKSAEYCRAWINRSIPVNSPSLMGECEFPYA